MLFKLDTYKKIIKTTPLTKSFQPKPKDKLKIQKNVKIRDIKKILTIKYNNE